MRPENSLLLLLTFLLASCQSSAEDKNQAQSFRAASNVFSFDRNELEVNLPTEAIISGWSVNCNRTRAIAWGQASDLLSVGTPPVAKIYIIDLGNESFINHYTVTRGPYEVVFSRNQKHASVDDRVIDQSSGETIGMTEDIKLVPESCPGFVGKQSG